MSTSSRPPPHDDTSHGTPAEPAALAATAPDARRTTAGSRTTTDAEVPPFYEPPVIANHPRRKTRIRRTFLLGAAALTIVVGLTVHTFATGPLADPAGDVLYAVMASLLVAFLMPRWNAWLVATVAFALCTAIELFQLTGVPIRLAERWAPIRLVLGTTFVPTDILAYAAGAGFVLIVSLGIAVVARWMRERRRETDRARLAAQAREAAQLRETRPREAGVTDAERRQSIGRPPAE